MAVALGRLVEGAICRRLPQGLATATSEADPAWFVSMTLAGEPVCGPTIVLVEP